MAKCAQCGAETELHELGVPVCTSCIARRERIHVSVASPSLAGLRADLTLARELYRVAMEALEHHQVTYPNIPKGHPGGIVRARLEEKAKTAGEKYWEGLRVYNMAVRKHEEEGT